jgi:hypothetical protein
MPEVVKRRLPDDGEVALERWLITIGDVHCVRLIQPTPHTMTLTDDSDIVARGEIEPGEWLPPWIEIDAKRYLDKQLAGMRRIVGKWEEIKKVVDGDV